MLAVAVLWPAAARGQEVAPAHDDTPAPDQASAHDDAVRAEIESSSVPVRLSAERPGTTYFARRLGDDRYGLVCTSPCQARLPLGPLELAVRMPGGRDAEAAGPVEIVGPGTIRSSHVTHGGMRIAGWVFIATGVPLGTGLAIVDSMQPRVVCNGPDLGCDSTIYWVRLCSAFAMVIGALAVGVPFVLKRDDLKIELVPDAGARLDSHAPPGRVYPPPAPDAAGVSILATF